MDTFKSVLFGMLLFVSALFLILLVLVQRGRGGGLSGALGGMGGQSAFGTKAGDLFTRITMALATVWILLCITTILVMNPQGSKPTEDGGEGTEFTRSVDTSTAESGPTGNQASGAGAGGTAEAPASSGSAPGGTQ